MEHANYLGTSTRGERPYEFSPNGPPAAAGIPMHAAELQMALSKLNDVVDAFEKMLGPILTHEPATLSTSGTAPIGTDGRRSFVGDQVVQARLRVEDLLRRMELLMGRVEL